MLLVLLAHAGLLAALLASVKPLLLGEPPPIQVQLVRPSLEPREPQAPPTAEAAPERQGTNSAFALRGRASAYAEGAPFVAPAAPPGRVPAGPVAPARGGGASGPDDRMRGTLRTTLGCDAADIHKLDAREREACRRHLRTLREGAPALGLSPKQLRALFPEADPGKPRVKPFLGVAPPIVPPAIDLGPGVTIGAKASIPFGHPPKALPVIPLSTLGDEHYVKTRAKPKPPSEAAD